MIIDHLEKIISIKIVYFGPAFSGKTTSIKALFSHFGKEEKLKIKPYATNDLISLLIETSDDYFYDYFPINCDVA